MGSILYKGKRCYVKGKGLSKVSIKTQDYWAFQELLFSLEDLNLEDEKYQKLRKRVLDYGNDAIREIEEDINKFDIHI